MRKLVLTLIFFIISTSAFASFSRSTSFDDREICEKDKGVWREFGNSLADNCESKFDQYSIAAQRITYACDCGKGRCWNGEHCVMMSEYKKFYDEIQAEEKKKLEIARKARAEQYRDTSNERLRTLITQKGVGAATNADGSPSGTNNNMAQFSDKIQLDSPVAAAQNVANNLNQQAGKIIDQTSVEAKKVQDSALGNMITLPTTNAENQNSQSPISDIVQPALSSSPAAPIGDQIPAGPTPFFMQQQEKAKQEAAAAAASAATAINNNSTTSPVAVDTKKDSTTSVALPSLPQISLPQ